MSETLRKREQLRYLLLAALVFAAGLFAFGILTNKLGDNNISLDELSNVRIGMNYNEVKRILNGESELEQIEINGQSGNKYTWIVYIDNDKYVFSTSCIDNEVVAISQSRESSSLE
ncbi:MAG: hypothetical protein ACK5LL_05325 [Suipraeoptans sp.]